MKSTRIIVTVATVGTVVGSLLSHADMQRNGLAPAGIHDQERIRGGGGGQCVDASGPHPDCPNADTCESWECSPAGLCPTEDANYKAFTGYPLMDFVAAGKDPREYTIYCWDLYACKDSCEEIQGNWVCVKDYFITDADAHTARTQRINSTCPDS